MNNSPLDFYTQLESTAREHSRSIVQVCQGLTWSFCKSNSPDGENLGFAQNPGMTTRTLSWPGTLEEKTTGDLGDWLRSWDFHQATLGLAALNSSINHKQNELVREAHFIDVSGPQNLAVFNYFKPLLSNKKIVIIGRYPGVEDICKDLDYAVIERNPQGNDFPDTSAEYLIPEADWVFITGTSIINKTFPRLAELSCNAVSVLMGPSVPWLNIFEDYDIDFLAGTITVNQRQAEKIAQEGGGTRLFEEGVSYAVANTSGKRLNNLKNAIGLVAEKRQFLKNEMETWYSQGNSKRFPNLVSLQQTEEELSRLDTAYKRLWDANNA